MELVLQPNGDYYIIDQKTTTMTETCDEDLAYMWSNWEAGKTFCYTSSKHKYTTTNQYVYDRYGDIDGTIVTNFTSYDDLITYYPELFI